MIVSGIGSDYWSIRNRLKNELSKKALVPSILIHPFEKQEIKCKVVGRPKLTETFGELGVARFSVVLQKCEDKIYPVASVDNTSLISNAMLDTFSKCEAVVATVKTTSGFVSSYQKLSEKLNAVYQVFYDAKRKVNMATAYVNTINATIVGFRNGINNFIALPEKMSKAVTNLFNTVLFTATNPLDNITFQKLLFGFGAADELLSNITVEHIEINRNNKILNNAINANSLAVCYGSLVGISFDTQDDLDATRSALNAQYESIYEDLDFDTQGSLTSLYALANSYLDTLDVDRVVSFNVDSTPLSVAVYNLYGDLANYDKISRLNKLSNNVMADGTIKIIAQES